MKILHINAFSLLVLFYYYVLEIDITSLQHYMTLHCNMFLLTKSRLLFFLPICQYQCIMVSAKILSSINDQL